MPATRSPLYDASNGCSAPRLPRETHAPEHENLQFHACCADPLSSASAKASTSITARNTRPSSYQPRCPPHDFPRLPRATSTFDPSPHPHCDNSRHVPRETTARHAVRDTSSANPDGPAQASTNTRSQTRAVVRGRSQKRAANTINPLDPHLETKALRYGFRKRVFLLLAVWLLPARKAWANGIGVFGKRPGGERCPKPSRAYAHRSKQFGLELDAALQIHTPAAASYASSSRTARKESFNTFGLPASESEDLSRLSWCIDKSGVFEAWRSSDINFEYAKGSGSLCNESLARGLMAFAPSWYGSLVSFGDTQTERPI